MTEYGLYEGTENSLKKAFMLTHNNERIFERSFEGDNSDIVDVSNNTITIPNHFFVTGEKLSMFMKEQVLMVQLELLKLMDLLELEQQLFYLQMHLLLKLMMIRLN